MDMFQLAAGSMRCGVAFDSEDCWAGLKLCCAPVCAHTAGESLPYPEPQGARVPTVDYRWLKIEEVRGQIQLLAQAQPCKAGGPRKACGTASPQKGIVVVNCHAPDCVLQVIEDTASVVQHVRRERGVPDKVPNIVIGGSYG